MTQTSQEQLDEEPGLVQRAWKTKNNGSIVQSCVNNACKNTGARGTRHDHYTIVESVETLFTVDFPSITDESDHRKTSLERWT